MEKIYKDTTWDYIEGSDGKVQEIRVDGYEYGERLLEGMPFYISLVDGHIKIMVRKKDEPYFNQLNTNHWFDTIYRDIVSNAYIGYEIPGGWDDEYYLRGKDFGKNIKKQVKGFSIGIEPFRL